MLRELFGWKTKPPLPEKTSTSWFFPTIEGRNPMELKLTVALGRTKGSTQYPAYIVGEIDGARHPCDPETLYNMIGDVAKNPALLPAMNYVRLILPVLIEQAVLRNLSGHYPDARKDEALPTSQGFSYQRHLGSNPLPNSDKRDREIRAAYDAIKTKIDRLAPEIEALVERHRGEQLPLEPSVDAMMEFDLQMLDTWNQFVRTIPADIPLVVKERDRFEL